jgi:hypothetical protein
MAETTVEQERPGQLAEKAPTGVPAHAPPTNGPGASAQPLPPRGPLRPPLRSLGLTNDPRKPKPTHGSNRAGRSGRAWPRVTKSLQREIDDFANRLKARYAVQIARDADARAFKKLCVRLLKQALPPGPGRPSEQSITLAMKLRAQGAPWKEVYPKCLLNHGRLSPAERRQAESNLRSARRSRENARAKKRSAPIVAGKIAPPKFSA